MMCQVVSILTEEVEEKAEEERKHKKEYTLLMYQFSWIREINLSCLLVVKGIRDCYREGKHPNLNG